MANIIPFESAKLPAHVSSIFQVSDDLSQGVGSGFPHVSIKGKVFHVVRGEERTLVTKPGEDEPAGSIEVVIIKANPSISKVYYTSGYVEGSDQKPSCYSNDGVAPAADAVEPQAKKCAVCPHNQWGSRITENGSQGKACSDSRRIAIAPVSQINDPMLLRVPATTLKPLREYNETLKKRGVPYQAVVTKIGFDYTVAHPALTFKPVGFIDDETAKEVFEVMNSDIVASILGTAATAFEGLEDVATPAVSAQEPAPAAKPAAKPAKPKAAPQSDALSSALGRAKPTVEIAVEAEEPAEVEAPKQAKPPKKPDAAVVEVDSFDELLSDIDSMMADD